MNEESTFASAAILKVARDQRKRMSSFSILLMGLISLILCLIGAWLSSYPIIFFGAIISLVCLLNLYRNARRSHLNNYVGFNWTARKLVINEINLLLGTKSKEQQFDDYIAARSAVLYFKSEGYRYELSLIGKSGVPNATILMLNLQEITPFGGIHRKDIHEPHQGRDLRNLLVKKMPITNLGFNPTFFANPTLD